MTMVYILIFFLCVGMLVVIYDIIKLEQLYKEHVIELAMIRGRHLNLINKIKSGEVRKEE